MPDRGLWTLGCQNCDANFTVELNPGQRILDFARGHPCPTCKKHPEDVSGAWHRIVAFKATPAA